MVQEPMGIGPATPRPLLLVRRIKRVFRLLKAGAGPVAFFRPREVRP